MICVTSGRSLPGVQRYQLRTVLRRHAVRDGCPGGGGGGWLGWRRADSRLPRLGGSADRHTVLDADDSRQRLRSADAARRQQRAVERIAKRQIH